MDKKPPQKHPDRNRVVLRRLIGQSLFLIFGLGLAVFYLLFNDGGEEQDISRALDNPATSTTERASGEHSPPPPGSITPETTRTPPPPYADKSLDELTAALAARFGGKAPSAWSEHPDGITARFAMPDDQGPAVALTLDACGGKKGASYDEGLIAFLRERNIPATLFVTSLWLRSNPGTLRELAADPLFEIAAHGSLHRPCSVSGKIAYGIKGTADFKELVEEVEGNLRDLERATGSRPRWYRSGTAYYDDIAAKAVLALGCGIAGYSIAGDEGATLPAAKVAAKTLDARHGDILLYHMNKPESGTREGLMKAVPLLVERGYRFVRLSDIHYR